MDQNLQLPRPVAIWTRYSDGSMDYVTIAPPINWLTYLQGMAVNAWTFLKRNR